MILMAHAMATTDPRRDRSLIMVQPGAVATRSWEAGELAFADHVRGRLERAALPPGGASMWYVKEIGLRRDGLPGSMAGCLICRGTTLRTFSILI